MEVKFADTFFESFEKIVNRERWYWKAWDFLRYDMPRFIHNIWKFRKALYNYRWYSGHHGVLPFVNTAITDIHTNVDKRGFEIRTTAEKKVAKMKRASEIMEHFIKEDFIDLAEKELGPLFRKDWEFEEVPDKPGSFQLVDNELPDEKAHNSKVYSRAREIEEEMWKELWKIFEGQDYSTFEKSPEGASHDESYDHWNKQFDGSGMRGWWD
jgi:hypothetical protein